MISGLIALVAVNLGTPRIAENYANSDTHQRTITELTQQVRANEKATIMDKKRTIEELTKQVRANES